MQLMRRAGGRGARTHPPADMTDAVYVQDFPYIAGNPSNPNLPNPSTTSSTESRNFRPPKRTNLFVALHRVETVVTGGGAPPVPPWAVASARTAGT